MSLQFQIFDGKASLNPPKKVPRHPICARKVNRWKPSIPETIDSAMFQESANDAPYGDIVTYTWDLCPQTTDAANEQPDLHTCL